MSARLLPALAVAALVPLLLTGCGISDASPASVRVTSASALPKDCTEITRRSLDSFGESWAPSTFPDRVERCGNWAVMKVDGGWFGWTPLAPAEVSQ